MIEKMENLEKPYQSSDSLEFDEYEYWNEDYLNPEMDLIYDENHIQIMEEKSNSTDENTRLESLQYPCPVSILEKLSKDVSPKVRAAVAVAYNTPEPILEKLIDDENEIVQRKIFEVLFENPFSNFDTLKEKILSEILSGKRTFPKNIQGQ